jgi:hypothetical protein
MIISLNDWAFVLGEICVVFGGYALYMRLKVAKRKKRHREFLVRGESVI